MKWVAGMMALLAIVSGCVSLNKGSDQVALEGSGKGGAEKQALAAAAVATDTTATGSCAGERLRDAPRREADLISEVSVASMPPPADTPSQRTMTRVVRASPPEPSHPRPAAPASEPAPAVPEATAPEPAATPAATAGVAANAGEAKLPTIINGTGEAAVVEPPMPRPTAASVRMVNSKRLSLNYEIKDVGPSGVSTVELWYTQNGRKWQKYDIASQPRPPFVVDLKEEGLYGFTLVARNGVGLGKRPPRPGDQPQIWVEVDTTKPVVKLLETQIGVSGDGQYLSIRWKATDNNLGQRPITLAYAEQAVGPWTPIAANLENSGAFMWQLPQNVPSRFLVRVEATDLVGNVGIAQMLEPILLDLSQPTVSIVAVEPAAK
jgi:hypothetical protein